MILALNGWLIFSASSIRAAEFEKYLPDDTEFVLHANIRQALDSALAQKYLFPLVQSQVKGQAEVQEILSALGLDPLKDLRSLTIAAPGKDTEKKWTAILQGSFDQGKIQSAVDTFSSNQPDTLKTHRQDGATIYEIKDTKRSQSAFVAFVEKEVLLASSSKNQVAAAISQKGAARPSNLDKDLLALIKEGSGKESLWVALVPKQLTEALPKDNKQLTDFAKKIKSFKSGITISDGVQLSFRVQATDDKAAREIHTTLAGIVKPALIFLITTSDQLKEFAPTLTDIVNAIKFTLDKSTVGMDLTVTGKQIEEGLKK
jgi:hypothetical protein